MSNAASGAATSFDDPSRYLCDDALDAALNVAMVLGQPLLVTGERGTGKTMLAAYAADRFDLGAPLSARMPVLSGLKTLFYSFDADGFRAAVADAAKSGMAAQVDPRGFLTYGPLGRAMLYSLPPAEAAQWTGAGPAFEAIGHPGTEGDETRRSVLLIDEADQVAPEDVDALLDFLEQSQYRIPELATVPDLAKATFKPDADQRPLVIIAGRNPDRFTEDVIGRCSYFHIELPDDPGDLTAHAEALLIAHRPSMPEILRHDAAALFAEARSPSAGLSEKPSIPDLLSFASGLEALGLFTHPGGLADMTGWREAAQMLSPYDPDRDQWAAHLESRFGPEAGPLDAADGSDEPHPEMADEAASAQDGLQRVMNGLFDRVEAAGFTVSDRQRTAAQAIFMKSLTDPSGSGKLDLMLAPVLASNSKQQTQMRGIVRDWANDILNGGADAASSQPVAESPAEEMPTEQGRESLSPTLAPPNLDTSEFETSAAVAPEPIMPPRFTPDLPDADVPILSDDHEVTDTPDLSGGAPSVQGLPGSDLSEAVHSENDVPAPSLSVVPPTEDLSDASRAATSETPENRVIPFWRAAERRGGRAGSPFGVAEDQNERGAGEAVASADPAEKQADDNAGQGMQAQGDTASVTALTSAGPFGNRTMSADYPSADQKTDPTGPDGEHQDEKPQRDPEGVGLSPRTPIGLPIDSDSPFDQAPKRQLFLNDQPSGSDAPSAAEPRPMRTPIPPPPTEAPKPDRSGWGMRIGAGLAVLALLAAGAYWFLSGRDTVSQMAEADDSAEAAEAISSNSTEAEVEAPVIDLFANDFSRDSGSSLDALYETSDDSEEAGDETPGFELDLFAANEGAGTDDGLDAGDGFGADEASGFDDALSSSDAAFGDDLSAIEAGDTALDTDMAGDDALSGDGDLEAGFELGDMTAGEAGPAQFQEAPFQQDVPQGVLEDGQFGTGVSGPFEAGVSDADLASGFSAAQEELLDTPDPVTDDPVDTDADTVFDADIDAGATADDLPPPSSIVPGDTRVVRDVTNVRTGPGLQFRRAETIAAGTRIRVMDVVEETPGDIWLEIPLTISTSGFIAATTTDPITDNVADALQSPGLPAIAPQPKPQSALEGEALAQSATDNETEVQTPAAPLPPPPPLTVVEIGNGLRQPQAMALAEDMRQSIRGYLDRVLTNQSARQYLTGITATPSTLRGFADYLGAQRDGMSLSVLNGLYNDPNRWSVVARPVGDAAYAASLCRIIAFNGVACQHREIAQDQWRAQTAVPLAPASAPSAPEPQPQPVPQPEVTEAPAPDPVQDPAPASISPVATVPVTAPTQGTVAAAPAPAAPSPAAPSGAGYAPGETFRDCPTCPQMIMIGAGSYTMGSSDDESGHIVAEAPLRRMQIRSLAIGKYEITRGQFAAFVAETGYRPPPGCFKPNRRTGDWRLEDDISWSDPGFDQTNDDPVVCISWRDAQAYVAWISRKTGQTYRLLSEAEWEYAGRAGSQARFSFGDDPAGRDFCDFANAADKRFGSVYKKLATGSCRDDFVFTAAVGTFRPNRFGLHDMHGNAYEMVEDCFGGYSPDAPRDGSPMVRPGCSHRVARGGAWDTDPDRLRSAARSVVEPDKRYAHVGFRIARNPQ